MQRFLQRIRTFIKDPEKKPYLQIFIELIQFGIYKREFPFFYFGKYLYRSGVKAHSTYLSSKEVDQLTWSKHLHIEGLSGLLRNKLAFHLLLERFDIALPRLLGYNFKNQFYTGNTTRYIASIEELTTYFEQLFDSTAKEVVFVKGITDMGGNTCYKISKGNLHTDIQNHGASMLKQLTIHQEQVLQHPSISKIYPHSLNTIRINSYIDKKGNSHILSAFMRFGSGGQVVDNSSRGGLSVAVSLSKHCLQGKSISLMKYGRLALDSHPDTGILFDGYPIPFLDEAQQLIHKALVHLPDRLVGWDVAISPTGPVLIEGNDNNSWITADIAYGGHLKHPIFPEILKEAQSR